MPKITKGLDGRIEHTELSSAEASEMGRKRWQKYKDDKANSLLREAGFNPDEAPQYLRTLADIATSSRSGAVSALTAFLKLTRKGAPENLDLQPGDTCPVCGQVVGSKTEIPEYPRQVYETVLKLISEARARKALEVQT